MEMENVPEPVNAVTGAPLSQNADAIRKRKEREKAKLARLAPEQRKEKWLEDNKAQWERNLRNLTAAEKSALEDQIQEWEFQHELMKDVVKHVERNEVYGAYGVYPDIVFALEVEPCPNSRALASQRRYGFISRNASSTGFMIPYPWRPQRRLVVLWWFQIRLELPALSLFREFKLLAGV